MDGKICEMKLRDKPFFAIAEGTKIFELRLLDEKRKTLAAGDIIRFVRLGSESECVCMRVKKLHVFPSFEKMFERAVEREGNFTPENMGFDACDGVETMVKGMREYYAESEERLYGAVAIELEKV